MRKYIILVILFSASLFVSGQDNWKYVTSSESGSRFYFSTKSVGNGANKKVWVKQEKGGVTKEIDLIEIDCLEGWSMVRQTNVFGKDGSISTTTPIRPYFSYPVPQSVDVVIIETVCLYFKKK